MVECTRWRGGRSPFRKCKCFFFFQCVWMFVSPQGMKQTPHCSDPTGPGSAHRGRGQCCSPPPESPPCNDYYLIIINSFNIYQHSPGCVIVYVRCPESRREFTCSNYRAEATPPSGEPHGTLYQKNFVFLCLTYMLDLLILSDLCWESPKEEEECMVWKNVSIMVDQRGLHYP